MHYAAYDVSPRVFHTLSTFRFASIFQGSLEKKNEFALPISHSPRRIHNLLSWDLIDLLRSTNKSV